MFKKTYWETLGFPLDDATGSTLDHCIGCNLSLLKLRVIHVLFLLWHGNYEPFITSHIISYFNV